MHNPFLNTSLSFYFYLSLTTLHLQINLQDPYNRFVFFLPLFFLSFFYLFSCFFFGQNVDLSLSITVTRGKGWWCRKKDNGCFLELEERRIWHQGKYWKYWAVGLRVSCGSTYMRLGDYRLYVAGADRTARGGGGGMVWLRAVCLRVFF